MIDGGIKMALNYNNEQLEAAKSISLISLAQAMRILYKKATKKIIS